MSAETKVIARWTDRRGETGQADVVNPAGWFGRTWLIEVGCGFSSFMFVVEADGACDAIDEFSDSEFGHLIHIDPQDMQDYPEDYPEDEGYCDGSGRRCDLDDFRLDGPEGRHDSPFPVRYFGTYSGHALPEKGIKPSNLDAFVRWKEERK